MYKNTFNMEETMKIAIDYYCRCFVSCYLIAVNIEIELNKKIYELSQNFVIMKHFLIKKLLKFYFMHLLIYFENKFLKFLKHFPYVFNICHFHSTCNKLYLIAVNAAIYF